MCETFDQDCTISRDLLVVCHLPSVFASHSARSSFSGIRLSSCHCARSSRSLGSPVSEARRRNLGEGMSSSSSSSARGENSIRLIRRTPLDNDLQREIQAILIIILSNCHPPIGFFMYAGSGGM